jgi:hypothetical protein
MVGAARSFHAKNPSWMALVRFLAMLYLFSLVYKRHIIAFSS